MELIIGAVAPKITKQLKDQGICYNQKDISYFQMDFDAIVRLKVRGMISDSEALKVEKRIMAKLSKALIAKKGKEKK